MAEESVSIKVNIQGKNILVAYLLWWFLGWAGVHRFYLGRVKSGLAQLLLVVIGWATFIFVIGYVLLVIWFIWWALDAYFTYKMVAEENAKLGVDVSSLSFSKNGSVTSDIDQLEKLHSLYEKGVITKEQYEAKKSTLI